MMMAKTFSKYEIQGYGDKRKVYGNKRKKEDWKTKWKETVKLCSALLIITLINSGRVRPE